MRKIKLIIGTIFAFAIVYIYIDHSNLVDNFFKEQKVTLKKECPKGPLESITSCVGASTPGWQNSGNYYYVSQGKPIQSICEFFLKISSTQASQLALDAKKCEAVDPTEWQKIDCRQFSSSPNWQCYFCDSAPANWNNQYYKMFAASNTCQSSVYFSAAGYKPAEFVKEINKFMQE